MPVLLNQEPAKDETGRLAFSTLGCPDWSWDEILRRGEEYGYQGVEIRMLQREVDLTIVPEFRESELVRRRRECFDGGLEICGLASSVRFHERGAKERAQQLETGRRYLDLASGLGAGFVRVFGDVLPSEESKVEGALEWIAEGLSQLGEFASPFGIEILLETHGDFTSTVHLPRLMELVSHSSVGILWDTHHPWRFENENPVDTWGRIGKWVRHTHWKDSRSMPIVAEMKSDEEAAAIEEMDLIARSLMSGHRSAHYCHFSEGEFPVANCLESLRTGGYCGWYCLEWEKGWHPEISDPEEIFPQFANRFKAMLQGL